MQLVQYEKLNKISRTIQNTVLSIYQLVTLLSSPTKGQSQLGIHVYTALGPINKCSFKS